MGESWSRYSSYAAVEVWDWLSVKFSKDKRELRRWVLDNAMTKKILDMEDIWTQGYSRRTRWSLCINGFRILASYCCDIQENQEMSVIQHRMSKWRPWIRWMSTKNNFHAVRLSEIRIIKDWMKVQKWCSELAQAGGSYQYESSQIDTSLGKCMQKIFSKIIFCLKTHHSLSNHSLFQILYLAKFYCIFGFEPLWKLCLGQSKILKEWTLNFHGSDRLIIRLSGVVQPIQLLCSRKASILCDVTFLLEACFRALAFFDYALNFLRKVVLCIGMFLFWAVASVQCFNGKNIGSRNGVFNCDANLNRATKFLNDVIMTNAHGM